MKPIDIASPDRRRAGHAGSYRRCRAPPGRGLDSPRDRPLTLNHLSVRGMPGSGSGDELFAWAGIDHTAIADAAGATVRR
ncbi:MAG: hypothetical protein M3N95_15440 [Actinomycetota bacterium]|nr:hypothetical protein [Actinomycetota bacterium]